MDKENPTEYTAVPPSAYPPTTVDTESYQPAPPLQQPVAQPPPPAYDPSKLLELS